MVAEIALKLFALVDSIVELYLGTVIKPFLKFHEAFYSALNKTLRKLLDDNKSKIGDWFTANFITYARTVLVIPTLLLLAWGHTILPSLIVILVDFGDFLDGVVARYWVDIKKEREKDEAAKDKGSSRPTSPTSDDDSFEIVTTGSPQALTSWQVSHWNRTYGGFVDAVCDKAFVVPCWIALLHTIPKSGYLRWVQYLTLLFLILAEVASGCIRFRAYFTSVGVPAPKVEGFDFSTSAVKADHVGKAKQTFEMVGSALFILPFARYLGLGFLFLAVPLAYESVRRKVNTRVMYVNGSKFDKLDHKVLKFLMQVKGMGSKLIVGFSDKKTEMILTTCACSCVDEVIAEAPKKLDLMFLEKQGIDYVISSVGDEQFVTDETLDAQRCLTIGEDAIARPLKSKEQKTD
eukprot:CAMPEP_0176022536 /NCGR_PEP_ID=MMETSP0120_2-20121206/10972_1 /TAXON_ID=160619 /ORGANISM="Kryptoperidinium foliaceum, Strain CCMP 1326" /LENGTH=404 /DNA_ID=CAMNT_0017355677 /DNA_START=73 /DNA_END=1287 /DNA_ORIENTATION=-